ncbi:aminotransferase [Arthrobacter sp. Helios]|uniref:aminotransferase n=1 Tax=Arthrobacter sp. Helios TaxID=2828862 RepID=UPI00206BF320|nr:aminotransferase [Arthrobacter sp. Helios]UPO76348.1 aminotransferase [Arthrobacter sp. Helios]
MPALIEPAGLPRPNVSPALAAEWAAEYFAVDATAVKELGSQQDRNFLLTTADGRRRLLKISNPEFSRTEIEAQNAAMQRLTSAGFSTPLPLESVAGQFVELPVLDGKDHCLRLLTFVEGTPVIDREYLSPSLRTDLGSWLGRTSRALAGFEHPGLSRSLQWDLRAGEEVVTALVSFVRVDWKRELLAATLKRVTAALGPLKDLLPVQAVHGDMTDDNVVYAPTAEGVPELAGIIDFSDAMYSWRVSELAVACASLFHHDLSPGSSGDPLTVLPMIRAFHEQAPLSDAEIQALWPLIVLRGAVLAVSGEHQATIDAGNDYASSALDREWTMFEIPARYDWNAAEAAIRQTLGVARGAAAAAQTAWPPLLPDLGTPAAVDFGWDSEDFTNGSWLNGAAEEERILAQATTGGSPAVTRFGEARLTRAAAHSTGEPANVALGVEVHTPQPLALHAPFAGTVTISGAPNGTFRLEGGDFAVVLCGAVLDPSVSSGQAVREGQRIGQTGPEGLWVWLLASGTYPTAEVPPRFVRASEFPGYAATHLDPAQVLGGTPAEAPPSSVTGTDSVLERRNRSFAALQAHYYNAPPRIERGWKEHLIDTSGRHYLDMVNNVTALGHGHPEVAEAAAKQWRLLNTNSRFHYEAVAELSERLLARVPDSLDTVLLVNSGSEAVELALRLGKAFTGREDVLCVQESYHGWSLGADAVSTSVSDNPRAAQTRPGWVHAAHAPNAYRGTHRGEGAGEAYARDAAALLQELHDAGTPVGTYIAEPRNGNAGSIGSPPGYLDAVYAAVRAQGGVCISDEVQMGYGRLGRYFWGFEEHGVVPDIITMAKAMGNGHPLGAVITRREIAEALSSQGSFFSSGGGSTLSSRIGVTVLDVIAKEQLQENAVAVGQVLTEGFRSLMERHALIGAVHGMGLYQGVEFVRSRETLEPAAEETRAVCDRMRELGVIVLPTGDRQNILKVKPPLCFTAESARFFLETLDRVLTDGW